MFWRKQISQPRSYEDFLQEGFVGENMEELKKEIHSISNTGEISKLLHKWSWARGVNLLRAWTLIAREVPVVEPELILEVFIKGKRKPLEALLNNPALTKEKKARIVEEAVRKRTSDELTSGPTLGILGAAGWLRGEKEFSRKILEALLELRGSIILDLDVITYLEINEEDLGKLVDKFATSAFTEAMKYIPLNPAATEAVFLQMIEKTPGKALTAGAISQSEKALGYDSVRRALWDIIEKERDTVVHNRDDLGPALGSLAVTAKTRPELVAAFTELSLRRPELAIEAFEHLSEERKQWIPRDALLPLLKSENPQVRKEALVAMGGMKEPKQSRVR